MRQTLFRFLTDMLMLELKLSVNKFLFGNLNFKQTFFSIKHCVANNKCSDMNDQCFVCVGSVCVDVGLLPLYRIYFTRRQRWQKNSHSVRKEKYGYLCKEDTLVKVTELNIIQFYIYIYLHNYMTQLWLHFKQQQLW